MEHYSITKMVLHNRDINSPTIFGFMEVIAPDGKKYMVNDSNTRVICRIITDGASDGLNELEIMKKDCQKFTYVYCVAIKLGRRELDTLAVKNRCRFLDGDAFMAEAIKIGIGIEDKVKKIIKDEVELMKRR